MKMAMKWGFVFYVQFMSLAIGCEDLDLGSGVLDSSIELCSGQTVTCGVIDGSKFEYAIKGSYVVDVSIENCIIKNTRIDLKFTKNFKFINSSGIDAPHTFINGNYNEDTHIVGSRFLRSGIAENAAHVVLNNQNGAYIENVVFDQSGGTSLMLRGTDIDTGNLVVNNVDFFDCGMTCFEAFIPAFAKEDLYLSEVTLTNINIRGYLSSIGAAYHSAISIGSTQDHSTSNNVFLKNVKIDFKGVREKWDPVTNDLIAPNKYKRYFNKAGGSEAIQILRVKNYKLENITIKRCKRVGVLIYKSGKGSVEIESDSCGYERIDGESTGTAHALFVVESDEVSILNLNVKNHAPGVDDKPKVINIMTSDY